MSGIDEAKREAPVCVASASDSKGYVDQNSHSPVPLDGAAGLMIFATAMMELSRQFFVGGLPMVRYSTLVPALKTAHVLDFDY